MNLIFKEYYMRGLCVLLFLLVTVGVSAQFKSQSITTWEETNLEDAVLVDVRTAEEYSAGHLNGALNIDWFSEGFANQIQEVPKTKTIYLYCKKGGRSTKAQELLASLGYSNVINLTGGYDAWVAEHN